jgi:hypothetical protein
MESGSVRALLILVVLAAACGDDAPPPARAVIDAQPSYAPLAGGTLIELTGSGFVPGDRVLVDGREVSFVDVVDATHIQMITPPGEEPGDVELVVFGASGTGSARGLFHYSTPPVVTAISPSDVPVTSVETVTVHGSGFVDEAAGKPLVLVHGIPIEDVTVIDDSTLSFAPPPGEAFSRPTIDVVNARGHAVHERAFLYTPSASPGLLLFPRYGESFAVFYNPADGTTVKIPARTGVRFTSVVRNDEGEYWGVDSTNNRFGRLNLETQDLEVWSASNTRLPAITGHGGNLYGLARYWGTGGRFGSVDSQTGQFEPIGTNALLCCGSYGLTSDGTTIWLTSRQDWSNYQLRTVDAATGDMGPAVIISGGNTYRIEELRWWRGSLYAATVNGRIVTIDPQTGAITERLTVAERISAIAAYEVDQ